MKKVIKSPEDRNAVVVPIVSLEELPHRTAEERATLIAELEETEAEMKAGHYTTYSPEWLRERFLEIFRRAA
jgi:hypothetical protein